MLKDTGTHARQWLANACVSFFLFFYGPFSIQGLRFRVLEICAKGQGLGLRLSLFKGQGLGFTAFFRQGPGFRV